MKRKFINELTEKIDLGCVFKINVFNMDYIIKKEEKKYVIYSLSDKKYKKYYDSLEIMFKKFIIYSESLEDNIKNIKIEEEIEKL